MLARILIVEDEPAIREMLALALSQAGYGCEQAGTVAEARVCMANSAVDLVLLDWMMPDMSGIDYTRELKHEALTRDLPVIMLTARSEEGDKIRGLAVGADDYVTKPFSSRELLARIEAVLRRVAPRGRPKVIEIDGLQLDADAHRVTVADEVLDMGPTEYRLLHYFMMHPERVHSRGQLLDHVWGRNVYVEERTVDVHIRRLRKTLARTGHDRFVQTVRGAGYRFSRRV